MPPAPAVRQAQVVMKKNQVEDAAEVAVEAVAEVGVVVAGDHQIRPIVPVFPEA